MRFRIILVAALAALVATASSASAQDTPMAPLVPRDKHPWGKFPPGSWKRIRQTVETYDQRGVATTSVRDTKITLKSVDAKGYTLLTEQIVEVAGRGVNTVTQEKFTGFSGESDGQKADVKRVGDSELVLNGRKVPCEVRKAVMNGEGSGRITSTVYYAPDVTPHVLRRELVVASGGETEPVTTLEEVVALGMPYDVLGRRCTAAFVHTVQKSPSQSRDTMEVLCDDVPGAVAAQWSKQLDAEGKLIGRTSLELIGFDLGKPAVEGPVVRPRLFDRKRARRADEKMSALPHRNH